MIEVWRKIPNFVGYEASCRGRIRSNLKPGTKSKIPLKNSYRVLYQGSNKQGYKTVNIQCLHIGKRKRYFVHRLVMLAFCGNSNLDVNHKNGIKNDNRLENLEYVTRSENLFHAYRTGLRVCRDMRGELHTRSKLKNKDVIEIKKAIKLGFTNVALGRKYKVHPDTISHIRCGKTWVHI